MKALPLLASTLILGVLPASANLQAWILFDPTIPGESSDPGYEGWAEAVGFSVKHTAEGLFLTCQREIDKASPLLMKHCCDGTHFDEVKLVLASSGGAGGPVEFWEVTLADAEVVSYGQQAEAGTDAPTEAVTLSWSSLVSLYYVFPPGEAAYPVTTIVSPDTDGDGLVDAYEEAVGLDPQVSNVGVDTDGDGLLDTDEFRLGTNPTDVSSFFKATAVSSGPDKLELTWPSVAGESYSIDYSPDLVTPFSEVDEVTATAPETTREVTRVLPAGFFRVRKDLP